MLNKSVLHASVALSVLAFAAQPAWAQTAAANTASAKAAEPEIVVTGSRLGRQGFDMPTPTKVLGIEQMQHSGATNVGDFLNQIPAFRPSTSNQTNTQTSGGAAGQVFADLRALGNIRTLTLVDGQRFVPSATTGEVDLNLIPSALVDRVEVVTGGVSAVYGSDAISGVVNVILNKKLQGLRAEVSAGVSDHGDDFERRLSVGAGNAFEGGRGHIVVGGEYVQSDGVGPFAARPWGVRNDDLVTFPASRPAGTPSRIYATGVTQTNAPLGGVVNGSCTTANCAPAALSTSSPLRGIGFGPGGVVQPFSYGNDTLNTGNAYNFTSLDGAPSRYGLQIALPVTRYTAMAHVDYDLTHDISGFVDVNYGRSGSHFAAAYPRDQNTSGLIIRRDNAFLPAALATTMDANGVTAVSLARSDADWNQGHPNNRNTTERLVAGLNGPLINDWKWDAHYEFGRNVYDSTIGPIRIENNYKFAQDAVYYNPTNNQILANQGAGIPSGYVMACRALVPGSTTYNPIAAAGCAPMNLFGINAPSAAALAYVDGAAITQTTTTEQDLAANLHGNLFDTWAGHVAVAVGAEYRKEEAKSAVDDLSRVRAFNYANPQPYLGNFSATEAYAEALVPLAKDMPFAHSLEINGAIRYTAYSISGTVMTWKGGATWEPVIGLKLRGTASHDIRAPNSSELFQNTQTTALALNPFSGANAQYTVFTLPSPSLKPERADTRTVGAVFSPQFIPGFNLSVDYYDIKVNGAIASYGATTVTNGCTAELASPTGAGYFCNFFNHTGTTINSLSLQLVNLASLATSGIDFDLSYRRPIWHGTVTARLYGTYVAHLITDDGLGIKRTYNSAGVLQTKGSVIDHAGQVGGFTGGINTGSTDAPNWQLNSSVSYDTGLWSVTATGRYVGGGAIDKTLLGPDEADYNTASPISIGNNKIDGRFYLDLAGSVNIVNGDNRKLQLYTVINNLFNVDPPFPTTAVSGLYDKIGRYYRVGLRYSY